MTDIAPISLPLQRLAHHLRVLLLIIDHEHAGLRCSLGHAGKCTNMQVNDEIGEW